MSGSARAGTTSREAPTRTARPDIAHCALSRARPGHLCLPLTIDSHGGRQVGSYPISEFLPGDTPGACRLSVPKFSMSALANSSLIHSDRWSAYLESKGESCRCCGRLSGRDYFPVSAEARPTGAASSGVTRCRAGSLLPTKLDEPIGSA
jgi:hypothetical protein